MTALEPTDATSARLPIIPEPPKRGAINNLKRALTVRTKADDGEFALSDEAAEAVARAVAAPDDTRRVALKRVSYLTTPSGTFTIARDDVNVLAITTYPLNPRVLETERYPAAEGVAADAGHLYWAQRDLEEREGVCELALQGGTRARVKQTLQIHSKSVRQQNPLDSIRDFGVMRPILLFPMRVTTAADDAPDRVVLASVEGSSRTAYAQWLHNIDPADPLYGPLSNVDVAHGITRALAEVRDAPAKEVTDDEVVKARTLIVPAEIVIGFRPAEGAERPTLRDGVDGLLALTHIDHPTPWTPVAVDQAIGDKVLETLYERGQIDSEAELRYLAGLMPHQEALAEGFDPWPARRAARILQLLSRDANAAAGRAIGEGVRRASFQKQASRPLKAQVAAALALRALPDATIDDHKALRSALSRAFELPTLWGERRSRPGSGDWRATTRQPSELRRIALEELARDEAPGQAARELAALAAWALTRHHVLRRGRTRGTKGSDPRDPQSLLGEMIKTRHGIETLFRAVQDDLDGEAPRQLDLKTFKPERATSGDDVVMTEAWIREEVVPYPTASTNGGTAEPVATPQDRFDTALRAIVTTVTSTPRDLVALDDILDEANRPMLSREGIDDAYAERLTTSLVEALTLVRRYNETYQARYGISVSEADSEADSDDGSED